MFDYSDTEKIYQYLTELYNSWKGEKSKKKNNNSYQKYSRRYLTEKIVSLIDSK